LNITEFNFIPYITFVDSLIKGTLSNINILKD